MHRRQFLTGQHGGCGCAGGGGEGGGGGSRRREPSRPRPVSCAATLTIEGARTDGSALDDAYGAGYAHGARETHGACAGGDSFDYLGLSRLASVKRYEGRAPARRGQTRRSFLRGTAATIGGLAATAAAVKPLFNAGDHVFPSLEEFLQKHYKELTPEEKEEVFARIRRTVKERYGVDANVRDPQPMDGVEFVYALNLSRCNGNRACVHACMKENNQSREPEMQYIRVVEIPRGTLDLEQGNHHYDHDEVPKAGHYYMPVQCHQCSDPPCVKVCPVEATWQEPDGITVVDYDWCIGCRYCEAACPYWARRFNFTEPKIPSDQINPDMGYLSNRPRTQGVMEKCTYCLHRTRVGRMPACLEACPTGARNFGNINDPNSEVSQILKNKRVFILKEDAGAFPGFFYYFDERHPRTAPPVPDTEPPVGRVELESKGGEE